MGVFTKISEASWYLTQKRANLELNYFAWGSLAAVTWSGLSVLDRPISIKCCFHMLQKTSSIRTFVKGKTAANYYTQNICTTQFIPCRILLTINLMHVSFKECKVHFTSVTILYLSLFLPCVFNFSASLFFFAFLSLICNLFNFGEKKVILPSSQKGWFFIKLYPKVMWNRTLAQGIRNVPL